MSSYSLDDLHSDIGHLAQLMDVIADMVVDGPSSASGPNYTRLNSLIWIARDLAQHLEDRTGEHYVEIGSTHTRRTAGAK